MEGDECFVQISAHGAAVRIRSMHIKRCNSLGEMIGPVAPPWASVLCRLGV